VDPRLYFPEPREVKWDLGYMGTYSGDRQEPLERLMLEPARQWPRARMVVAGAQYPASIQWPENVKRVTHVSPDKHRRFYCSQKFTLNLTRAEMRRAGYSPSVRLFEAAACGTAIVSDSWNGLATILRPGKEILVTESAAQTLEYLRELPDAQRVAVGLNARERILKQHTSLHRAAELEAYVAEVQHKTRRSSLSAVPVDVSPLSALKFAQQSGD